MTAAIHPQHSTWGQCYAYFGQPDALFDLENASLRLAFYLASFGMFRGSGKIRKLAISDFGRLAKVCRQHKQLRDRKPRWLQANVVDVVSFLEELRHELDGLGVASTDTLISKIALGTTACVPAYDRYAKRVLRRECIIATPSSKGLEELFALRDGDLSRFGASLEQGIPFMRCLDLGLYSTGEKLPS